MSFILGPWVTARLRTHTWSRLQGGAGQVTRPQVAGLGPGRLWGLLCWPPLTGSRPSPHAHPLPVSASRPLTSAARSPLQAAVPAWGPALQPSCHRSLLVRAPGPQAPWPPCLLSSPLGWLTPLLMAPHHSTEHRVMTVTSL